MAEKLQNKLKSLFSRNRNAPSKGAYPAKFEQKAFKAGQKTKSMMKALNPTSFMKAVDKPASASKALITSSAAKKLRTVGKIAKAGRLLTPVGLGLTAAGAVYDVATMSPEKKAKVKKLKTKLKQTSTKDYHADLLKMSTGGGTMLKGGQKKLDKNKDGKISGEDFKMMKAKSGKMMKANMGMEAKSTQGYGAARTSGMGLQDEELIPGKSLDYYKDVM